jgi:hypothetical protein
MTRFDASDRTLDVVVIFARMYFWFVVSGVAVIALQGEARALLAILSAILSFRFVGRKIVEFTGL